jgi:DNA repair exonuclease SbcCD ATPase subunit
MLALRFLTVSASTTSPFMLLDEPMESLDPPNRRLVASVLTGADRPVDQMIVTTYEEPLVRRLHAEMPDIKIHVLQ